MAWKLKACMLGMGDGYRLRGRPDRRWIDELREPGINIQGLNFASNDRIKWRSLVHQRSVKI